MDHSPAVGKGDRVTDFLENREQRGQGIFGDRPRQVVRDQIEHLSQRDAPDEFHRVEDLVVFIDAQFVHGHDIRVLELAGDFRLGNEAGDVVRRSGIEHDLHRHVALDGGLSGGENGAHPALGHDSADVIFPVAQEFLRQNLPDDGRMRGQRLTRTRDGSQPVEFDRGQTHLDSLIGPKARAFGDSIAIDESAIRTAEVLDERVIGIDRQPRVLARDPVHIDLEMAIFLPADEVLAQRDGPSHDFHAVLGDDYFRLGFSHRATPLSNRVCRASFKPHFSGQTRRA